MKKDYSLCGVVIIIVTTAVISALSTGILIMRNYSTDDGQSYSEIIKDENIQEFIDVYSKLTTNNYQTFRNIQILFCGKEWVMISKISSPSIHFVIHHPKLRDAIENFIPPVVEK